MYVCFKLIAGVSGRACGGGEKGGDTGEDGRVGWREKKGGKGTTRAPGRMNEGTALLIREGG